MNLQDFRNWQDDVREHIESLTTLTNERRLLKKNLENHLRQFFDFTEIEYDRDFHKITLKWSKDDSPFIRHDMIGGLYMDWIISSEYDDMANRIIVVEVYPFGVDE